MTGPHSLGNRETDETEWRKYASVNWPLLVEIMACRLVGTKPLSQLMLIKLIGPLGTFTKIHLKMLSENSRYFVSSWMCEPRGAPNPQINRFTRAHAEYPTLGIPRWPDKSLFRNAEWKPKGEHNHREADQRVWKRQSINICQQWALVMLTNKL